MTIKEIGTGLCIAAKSIIAIIAIFLVVPLLDCLIMGNRFFY